jgi:hypothetical protein
MIAVMGTKPVLVGVNDVIEPVPVVFNPIDGLLFVHVINALLTLDERLIVPAITPLHRFRLGLKAISGAGFTGIRKDFGIP